MSTFVYSWHMEYLGQAIQALRKSKGWSLAKLEAKSGVSKAYIQKLESGERGKRPGMEIVERIAAALGKTVDELKSWRPPDIAIRDALLATLTPEQQRDIDDRIKRYADSNRKGLSDAGETVAG